MHTRSAMSSAAISYGMRSAPASTTPRGARARCAATATAAAELKGKVLRPTELCRVRASRFIAHLLETIKPLKRGLEASDADKAAVEDLASQLEKRNPNPNSLSAPEINGKWELVYTTSNSILGTNRPPFVRPIGPIYQTIDANKLRAKNQETWPFFNNVTADLSPESKSRVFVKFDTFGLLNFIPVKAPDAAVGWLDTTYVDDDLRISRGDKGNLFVLTISDRTATL